MIVVAGEALIDLARDGDRSVALPGGSPFNVAIGLARLGRKVAYLGALSEDAYGDLLARQLHAEHVDLAFTAVIDAPSTLAVIELDEDGHASYRFELDGTSAVMLDIGHVPTLPAAAPLHVSFGAVTAQTRPGGVALARLLQRERGRRMRSLDPNVRPTSIRNRRAYAAQITELAIETELVKTSDEDLAWLFPTRDPVEVAREWVGRGAGLVVVTRGAQGATALRPGHAPVAVPARDVAVTDTVGAGDAFTAGLLACLDAHDRRSAQDLAAMSDDALHDALYVASDVAALACTRPGADPPRLDELSDPVRSACIPAQRN